MDIKDHIIVGVQFKQTPNIHGSKIVGPKFLIIHYSASGDTAGTVRWLTNPASNVSAHVVIGRGGEVVQLASFDQRCKHCGESAWNGDTHLNFSSIGIELVNWGPVEINKDGNLTAPNGPGFRSKWGQEVPADQVEQATHKNETKPRYWQKFTPAQLAKCAEVSRAILQAYPSIEDVLGHDDIAIPKGRKSDPGPLFPWDSFLVECGWNDAPAPIQAITTIENLTAEITPEGLTYFTVSDSEGDVTATLTTDEARALRDWLTENLKG